MTTDLSDSEIAALRRADSSAIWHDSKTARRLITLGYLKPAHTARGWGLILTPRGREALAGATRRTWRVY